MTVKKAQTEKGTNDNAGAHQAPNRRRSHPSTVLCQDPTGDPCGGTMRRCNLGRLLLIRPANLSWQTAAGPSDVPHCGLHNAFPSASLAYRRHANASPGRTTCTLGRPPARRHIELLAVCVTLGSTIAVAEDARQWSCSLMVASHRTHVPCVGCCCKPLLFNSLFARTPRGRNVRLLHGLRSGSVTCHYDRCE